MEKLTRYLTKDRWSSYLVGVLIGLLSWVTFGYMHKALGVSSVFVKVVAFLEFFLFPEHAKSLPYLENMNVIDWRFMLVLGIPIGGYLASTKPFGKTIPKIWKERYGDTPKKLYLHSFIGGVIIMFGARLAGGCTSGHGISGGITLAVSSWIFLICFFIAGIVTSKILYRRHS